MTHSPVDDRSPFAKAIEQGSTVTTIALVMVVPAVPGYWLDTYLKTVPLFTIIGLICGMTAGIWQLIQFVNRANAADAAEQNADATAESADVHDDRESTPEQ